MKKLTLSPILVTSLASLAFACTSDPPPSDDARGPSPVAHAPEIEQAPSPHSIDLAASPTTTKETGVVRWTGSVGPGARIRVEGATAAGVVRVAVSTAGMDPKGENGALQVSVRGDDGAIAGGALELKKGKVVANTLSCAKESAILVGHFRRDFGASPKAMSFEACENARDAYFLAVLQEEVACASGNALACILAVGVALNKASAMNVACDLCPCPDGYTCTSGECTQVQSCVMWSECGYDSCGEYHGCASGECNEGTCVQACDMYECYNWCGAYGMTCDEYACECL